MRILDSHLLQHPVALAFHDARHGEAAHPFAGGVVAFGLHQRVVVAPDPQHHTRVLRVLGVCGTCLDFLGLMDELAVGSVGAMPDSVAALLADDVLTIA